MAIKETLTNLISPGIVIGVSKKKIKKNLNRLLHYHGKQIGCTRVLCVCVCVHRLASRITHFLLADRDALRSLPILQPADVSVPLHPRCVSWSARRTSCTCRWLVIVGVGRGGGGGVLYCALVPFPIHLARVGSCARRRGLSTPSEWTAGSLPTAGPIRQQSQTNGRG